MGKKNYNNYLVKVNKIPVLLFLLIVVSIVFWIIYGGLFFGDSYYIYTDIGADTLRQYIPQIIYDLRRIWSGSFSGFDLTRGFGTYYVNLLYKYLNPVNLPILLLGETHIGQGLVLATYLKYIVMAVFGYLFFKELFENERAALICALIWTFCGFAVLWGQHYHFLTSLAAFTVEIWGVFLFIKGKNKLLIVPAVAYLAYCGYFFLYVSCFFIAAFSILYLALTGEKITGIIKKAVLFAFALIAAVGIAGEYIVPSIGDLLTSTRMGSVKSGMGVSLIFSYKHIIAFLGRIISNDFLGCGSTYQGPNNYYEIASLSTSLLFIFGFVFLCHTQYRKIVVRITIPILILLVTPYGSKLVSLRATTQRWTFILCLAEVILIGFFWKQFEQMTVSGTLSQQLLERVIKIFDLVILAFVVLFWLFHKQMELGFDTGASLKTMILVLVYNYFFLFSYRQLMSEKQSGVHVVQKIALILLCIVAVEMIAANYSAVMDRGLVKKENWEEKIYYDETQPALDWIRDHDPEIFRVNKTYRSGGHNDAMIQGFYGVSIYDSTNSAWLVNYASNLGYIFNNTETRTGSNWIHLSPRRYEQNLMTGVKYILYRDDPFADEEKKLRVDEDYYEEVHREDSIIVYRNKYWNGFGYFYDREIPQQEVEDQFFYNKGSMLTKGFYYTLPEDATPGLEEQTDSADPLITTFDLFPHMQNAEDCDVEMLDEHTMHITGTDDDMRITYKVPDRAEELEDYQLHVTMECEEKAVLQIYVKTKDHGFKGDYSEVIDVEEGSGEYCIDLSRYKNIQKIRFDPSKVKQNITVTDLTISGRDESVFKDYIEDLFDGGVGSIRQDGDTFLLPVDNDSYESRMLCIPFIYDEKWQLTVDGADAKVQNINGGLVGVWIEPGEHEVSLTYVYNRHITGRLLGLLCLLLYILFVLAVLTIKKHRLERRHSRYY